MVKNWNPDHDHVISKSALLQGVFIKSHRILIVCLFGLMHNIPVNSYGHAGTVSSPNHTFFLGKLD